MATETVESEDLRKIFVSDIVASTTEEELKAFAEEKIGADNIQEVKLVCKEGAKKCFGFITVTSIKAVDDFLLTKDGIKFKDSSVTIKRAVPKDFNHASAHEKTKKLFIANLPKKGVSSDDVKAYLETNTSNADFGVIESVQLVMEKDSSGNPTEDSKGYGFIEVSSEDYCDKLAIEHTSFEMNGRKVELKKSLQNPQAARRGGRGGGRGFGGGRGRGGNAGGGGGYGGYGGYGGQIPYDPYGGWFGGADAYGYGYAPRGRYAPY